MNSVHVCGVCVSVCVCPTWWIGFLFTCLWNKATAKFQPLLDILLISHRPILSTVHECMCVCELTHIAAVVQCHCMVVVNDRFLLCSLQCSVCVLYVCVSFSCSFRAGCLIPAASKPLSLKCQYQMEHTWPFLPKRPLWCVVSPCSSSTCRYQCWFSRLWWTSHHFSWISFKPLKCNCK